MARLALRDHPQLNFLGRSSWPPIWVHTRTQPYKRIIGEVGVFTGTRLYELRPRLFVQMEYEQQPYVGCLVTDNVVFALELHQFLLNHIGLSIKEIGDLDLSHTLSSSPR